MCLTASLVKLSKKDIIGLDMEKPLFAGRVIFVFEVIMMHLVFEFWMNSYKKTEVLLKL